MRGPGDVVLLRYVHRGRPVGALPTRAVSSDGPVLWLAGGTPVKQPALGGLPARDLPPEQRFGGVWDTIDGSWSGGGALIVGRPGRAHAIWLLREQERFAGWYVNLEAPWRPTRDGFETEDHTLDLVVSSAGTARWKDEDELAVALDAGVYTAEQAAAFRAEGERVLAEWPFPTGWEDWRPDTSWPVPTLPEGWDAV